MGGQRGAFIMVFIFSNTHSSFMVSRPAYGENAFIFIHLDSRLSLWLRGTTHKGSSHSHHEDDGAEYDAHGDE